MNKKVFLWLVVLSTLVAAFFRLWHIDAMPGGLFPDEAANGLDINLMEQGQLQPFYERGNGREALFFYLLWAGVKLFGRSPFTHHFITALIGLGSVWVCYLVTKVLFSKYSNVGSTEPSVQPVQEAVRVGRKSLVQKVVAAITPAQYVALLSLFLMATSTWHIVLSRTAFRANMTPLLTALTLWALLSIPFAKTRARQYWWALLFGASFALGFYTYIAYRVMAPLLFLLVLWPFLAALKTMGLRALLRQYAPLLVVSVLSFAVVIAPLTQYFYNNPDWFVGRGGQVSVFSPQLNGGDLVGTVLEVTRLSFNAYFTDGDLNWRHNISGLPFLSPIVSPFFALGLLLVLYGAVRYVFAPRKQSKRYPHFLLAGWFASFLLPVITTAEGIPHGLRAIGTIPVVFIITAYGLYCVGHFVWRIVKTYPHPHSSPKLEAALQRSLQILAVCFALALPIQAYANYFIFAANSAENFYAFRSDLTVVSEYLKEHGSRSNTYLVLDKFSVQTVEYLTTVDGKNPGNPANAPYMQVDPEESWLSDYDIRNGRRVWQAGLEPGMRVVFAQSSIFDIRKFKLHHPEAVLETEARNKFGQAVLAVYRIQE